MKAAAGSWLTTVNYYRSLASLPSVTENPVYSDGCYKHARYMAKNKVMAHSEDQSNPWYTPEGDEAAQNSNLVSRSTSEKNAVESWMEGPFHAVGIIDPHLSTTGFGRYADGGAAALDVLRGTGNVPSSVTFPIKWPSGSKAIPLLEYSGREIPDPLTSSPGYSAPSGLPIILQLGEGSITPNVTASSFSKGAKKLEHFTFDETNYNNSDSSGRSLGRSVLNSRDAVVLVPRKPLEPGSRYSASITVNGQNYSWSFNTAVAKTSVSLRSSSRVVKAGALATLSGIVKSNIGSSISRKLVIKANGRKILTSMVQNNGSFTVKTKPQATTIYQAFVGSSGGYKASKSKKLKVVVR